MKITVPNLTNDLTYYARQFPRNSRNQYQTEYSVVSGTPKAGIFLSSLPEGAVIQLSENGVPVPFYLAKHNYESGLNGAGRTLMVRKDCYDRRRWGGSGTNKYEDGEIDIWLNETYKNLFDTDIIAAMDTTKFPYTPLNNKVSVLARSVFLLSTTELGKTYSSANTEGSALPIASALQIANFNGSAVEQWTRTRNIDGEHYEFACLFNSKGIATSTYATNPNYSRPAFTLPADFLLSPDPNADGSYSPI